MLGNEDARRLYIKGLAATIGINEMVAGHAMMLDAATDLAACRRDLSELNGADQYDERQEVKWDIENLEGLVAWLGANYPAVEEPLVGMSELPW